MNMDAWVAGTGAISGFGDNVDVAGESNRVMDTDPWGNSSLVWGTFPSGNSGPDGGWNGWNMGIDRSRMYRMSVWVRRTSATTGGTFYFGLSVDGSGIKQMDTSAVQGNPYWDARGIGGLPTQNLWYLAVGHVYPYNTTYTGKHPQSGIYTVAGGDAIQIATACNIGSGDVKWNTDSANGSLRVYHYYCPDTTSRLQFYQPRIDKIDGSEPSLLTLLKGPDRILQDGAMPWSANSIKNPGIMYGLAASGGSFTYNGSTSGIDLGNPLALQCTQAMTCNAWIYPTADTQGNFFSKNYNSGFLFWRAANATLILYCSANAVNTSAGWVPLNQWNMVTGVADQTGLKIYVNGVLAISNTVAFNGASMGSGNGYIGCALLNNEVFNGKISNVQIYNRGLTQAEILQEFYATRGRYGR